MRRSVSAGSAVAKEVMPSCFSSCLSGEVLSRGYFNGDAVEGGVTLPVTTEESLWVDDSMARFSLERDGWENELTLGVGGVSIGGSSFALLLLAELSSIIESVIRRMRACVEFPLGVVAALRSNCEVCRNRVC